MLPLVALLLKVRALKDPGPLLYYLPRQNAQRPAESADSVEEQLALLIVQQLVVEAILSRIERGEPGAHGRTLRQLAKALGVSVEKLVKVEV